MSTGLTLSLVPFLVLHRYLADYFTTLQEILEREINTLLFIFHVAIALYTFVTDLLSLHQ